MDTLGVWLRKQREERLWSRTEMARRLVKAASANGDTSLPSAEHVAHNIYRWERGKVAPAERYRLYYCKALGILAQEFGGGEPKPEDLAAEPEGSAVNPATIIIMISLPEGVATQVRIKRLGDYCSSDV